MALGILLLVGADRLLTRSDDYVLIVWQSLALASVAQGVVNLIPHASTRPMAKKPVMGLGIIRSFLRPDGYYAAMIGQAYREPSRDWEPYDPADWWKRGS